MSCGLRELPETLTELKKLTHLELRGLPITVFPNVISKLTTLKSLDFQNRVLKLPDDLENLKALEKLNLSGALNGGTHIDRLSTASLLHVIRAGFRSSYDNFDVTNKALSVLSSRGDVEAELEVVKIFQKACEHYDAGHRYWGATTLDNFSDDYLRKFSPQALSVLLAGLGTDALNSKYGDAMDALFVCAFKGADEETKTKLSNTLIDYAQEAVEYYGALYFKKLISECEQAYGAPLETLAHTLDDLESLAQWTRRLNEEPSSVNELFKKCAAETRPRIS